MRAIVRTEGAEELRFYVLRTCERRSDPPPMHVIRSMMSARLYHAEGLDELERRKLLFRRDIGTPGCESLIIFVSCDAHARLGGAEAGFLKTFKRRTRTSFVHQSEVMAKSEFWDEQLRWLSQKIGVVVTFEHRQRRGERIPMTVEGMVASGSEEASNALALIMSRLPKPAPLSAPQPVPVAQLPAQQAQQPAYAQQQGLQMQGQHMSPTLVAAVHSTLPKLEPQFDMQQLAASSLQQIKSELPQFSSTGPLSAFPGALEGSRPSMQSMTQSMAPMAPMAPMTMPPMIPVMVPQLSQQQQFPIEQQRTLPPPNFASVGSMRLPGLQIPDPSRTLSLPSQFFSSQMPQTQSQQQQLFAPIGLSAFEPASQSLFQPRLQSPEQQQQQQQREDFSQIIARMQPPTSRK